MLLTKHIIYDWSSEPVFISLDASSRLISKVDFPAVAICNINKISKHRAAAFAKDLSRLVKIQNETEILNLIRVFGNLYDVNMHGAQNFAILQDILDNYDNLSQGNDLSLRLLTLNTPCNEILLKCSWNSVSYNCLDLFQTRLTDSGFCCIFNYVRRLSKAYLFSNLSNSHFTKTPRKFPGTGVIRGLSVTISNNISDYFYTDMALRGYLVKIFSPEDFPDLSSGSLRQIIVKEKSEVFIKVEANTLKSHEQIRLIPIYLRKCKFHDEEKLAFGSYTTSNCFVTCKTKSILSLCNCIPFMLPIENKYGIEYISSCTLVDIPCLNKYQDKWLRYYPTEESDIEQLHLEIDDSLRCDCLPNCNDVTYTIDTNYFEYYSSNPVYQNNSRIHIFTNKAYTNFYKKMATVTWYEALSTFGGVVSLLLGISIVNLVEIVVADILLEFFEVVVHNIIYVRKLYPSTIFVPKKKYGVTVYQAAHPGVQEYIKNCLKAVAFHCRKKQLKRLFICFESNETILEKFIFDILAFTELFESDVFLVELEQSLRNFMLRLHSSQIYLDQLPPDATFSIQLQTTFYSNLELNEDPVFEVTKRKRSGVRIRFKEEALRMKCQWDHCCRIFHNFDTMYKHLIEHVNNVDGDVDCKWTNCPNPTGILSTRMIACHISYHGYLAKLINIGENILNRNNLPDCTLELNYTIEISEDGYICQWEGCNFNFNTVCEFFGHVECHLKGAPSGKRMTVVENIPCLWSGCAAKFSTRYKLGDHLKVHTKEKMLACPKCVSLFSTKTAFYDHRKRQLKTHLRSYQCSQCLKLFSSERILSDHMRSHINQYKCTLCDMTSTKPSMLAKHYRYRHMNVRPFTCQLCEKTFVTKSNLNTHLLTHQDKPFKCDQCDFGCKSKVGLASHVLKVHGIEKPFYECQVCKILFRRGDYLTKHLIKIHKFHWPSGHSRFRYRKDSDGVCRLQTVRYESLEVTEEMIKSESMKPVKNSTAVTYNVTYDKNEATGYKLTVSQDNEMEHIEDAEKVITPEKKEFWNQEIIISIEDVDDKGNVIQRQEIGSGEIFLLSSDGMSQDSNDNLVANSERSSQKIPDTADNADL